VWRVLSSRFPDEAAAQNGTGKEEREPEDTDRKPSMRRPKTIMPGNALRQPARPTWSGLGSYRSSTIFIVAFWLPLVRRYQ
jgi:hypothetical protein